MSKPQSILMSSCTGQRSGRRLLFWLFLFILLCSDSTRVSAGESWGENIDLTKCQSAEALRESQRAETESLQGRWESARSSLLRLYELCPDTYVMVFIARLSAKMGAHNEASYYYKLALTKRTNPSAREDWVLTAQVAQYTFVQDVRPHSQSSKLRPAVFLPAESRTTSQQPLLPSAQVAEPGRATPKRLYRRWWLWGSIGVTVVGGIVVGSLVVALRPHEHIIDFQ